MEHPILTNILLLIVPLGTHWRLVLFFCLYFIFLLYGAVFLMRFLRFFPQRMVWSSTDNGTAVLRPVFCFCFQFLRLIWGLHLNSPIWNKSNAKCQAAPKPALWIMLMSSWTSLMSPWCLSLLPGHGTRHTYDKIPSGARSRSKAFRSQ